MYVRRGGGPNPRPLPVIGGFEWEWVGSRWDLHFTSSSSPDRFEGQFQIDGGAGFGPVFDFVWPGTSRTVPVNVGDTTPARYRLRGVNGASFGAWSEWTQNLP